MLKPVRLGALRAAFGPLHKRCIILVEGRGIEREQDVLLDPCGKVAQQWLHDARLCPAVPDGAEGGVKRFLVLVCGSLVISSPWPTPIWSAGNASAIESRRSTSFIRAAMKAALLKSFPIRARQAGSVPSGSTTLGPLTSFTLSTLFRLNNESAGTKE